MESLDKSTVRIAGMFNDIAPKYDFLNHFLSFGIDRYWRWRLARSVAKHNPHSILDVATGTGDLAMLLHRKTQAVVTGVDIAKDMLTIADNKYQKKKAKLDEKFKKFDKVIDFRLASAEELPFPDNTFDAVTVAFGVRNFEHLEQGLIEMLRVLKPGGIVAILEFTTPKHPPMKQFYRFYSSHIIPSFGRLFSKDKEAYRYLPSSIGEFPQRDEFTAKLNQAGFKSSNNNYRTFTGGICGFYMASKK